MALSPKHKQIRDTKLNDLAEKIAGKEQLIQRMTDNHVADIAKIQDELDELIFIRDTLASAK